PWMILICFALSVGITLTIIGFRISCILLRLCDRESRIWSQVVSALILIPLGFVLLRSLHNWLYGLPIVILFPYRKVAAIALPVFLSALFLKRFREKIELRVSENVSV